MLTAPRRAIAETVSGLPRAFWWLWTSTLINRLGGFVVTYLALYLTVQRGFSASYAGLVAALYGLGGTVGALVGGVLSDRIGRRSTMLTAQLGAAATTAVLGLVTHPVAIAAAACAVGVTSNASRPAVQAVMADVVPDRDRVRAFSLNYWAINIGFGVSAAVAGVIAAHGYLLLFLGDAATTLLCALVVFTRIPETRPAAAVAAKDKPAGERPAGLSRVLRDGRFMAVVGLTFLLGTVTQQGSNTLAVAMGRSGLTSAEYGLVIGVNGLLIVVLQIPLTRLMQGRDRGTLLLVASVLLGGGFGLTFFATAPWFYALTVVVWTLGEIAHAPTSMSVVAELSPVEARGRYQGMYSLAWSAATFAGPLAGGVALDRWGAAMWPACAVIGVVVGVGYRVLLRGRRAAVREGAVAAAQVSPGAATGDAAPR
ncbi:MULTISPECIES: MDR family MFS transporter [Streptomycetaceae]|uniref:Major facilitator superfamily permease n=1 Tax=Streptantibioticus cattleyicolor (strain ATCC 35852 / DSM 46488 / JCM 4925 / NBRC 14057 / NRRL 8057) TaxID=1003195 RepID=F8K0Z8_STREN|nr:MFS transporter [Streptantibioticus cattleyicolor]AEW94855.1 major facilitator superfamily permease [Streptantibioticus cattleyicolor NRRL 8057 = DSM 46488]MYS59473.1 MFS transporter [Streptomyces sp. SID5468]CCB75209.1 putative permease of the major facilitator superfamily [Streptantibioticus cattleyicolor NRRL 8057 = DSM 46488]